MALYERILADVGRFSMRAAERVSLSFIRASEQVGQFPGSGRMIPEFDDPDLREVVLGKYRLWYRLSGAEIEIVTIWPAALPVEDV